ncbi:hypothetical protein LINGRAPRIM_LOCUS2553 [Linum grandiflorum]
MLVDTDPFPNILDINMVNSDFSKARFKLVLDTSPPPKVIPQAICEQGGSSTSMAASLAASGVSSDVYKLCVRCKNSLTLGEARPTPPVQHRLVPSFRPRYTSYQRQVEGVRKPVWSKPRKPWVQSRQFAGYGHPPMRKTFRMPNVPPGGWYTYDFRH